MALGLNWPVSVQTRASHWQISLPCPQHEGPSLEDTVFWMGPSLSLQKGNFLHAA